MEEINLNKVKIYKGEKELNDISQIYRTEKGYDVRFKNKDKVFPYNEKTLRIVNLEDIQNTELLLAKMNECVNPVKIDTKGILANNVECESNDPKKLARDLCEKRNKKVIKQLSVTGGNYPIDLVNGKLKNSKYREVRNTIFPFGVNESQYNAVVNALENQYTIIEGPPGTGKTQTILNIVANLIIEKKTICIISATNAAVDNIYEKLEENDLNHLMASIGNQDKTKTFFEKKSNIYSDEKSVDLDIGLIYEGYKKIKSNLTIANIVADLKNELHETQQEYRHLIRRFANSSLESSRFINLLNSKMIIRYIKFLEVTSFKKALTQKNSSYMLNLNIIFYEKYISELQHKIKKMQMKIKDQAINKLNEDSLKYFKAFASKNEYTHSYETKDTYIKNFRKFIKSYPVVGTTSSSIYNTKGTNFQYDYLIIDEASQMNVYEGLSAITCAKNIIVVGDERQLQPVTSGFKQNTVGKIDMTQGFLTLFKRICDVSTIMLKEHYRCDRSIINFCNQFFYDKQLKIHTEFNGKTMDIYSCDSQEEVTKVGNKINDRDEIVISPYKDNKYETIYSFQGREAEHVYFAIDKDYLTSHTRNKNLINVAVSRAKKTLTLISKDFSTDSSIVGDLFKYIKYYTYNELEYEPKTLFVKLYKKKKLGKLSPAEVDAEELLKVIYKEDKSVDHLYEYRLSDLVNNKIGYDDEQLDYIFNKAHIDFLIYSTANKEPILAIEVDGNSFHSKVEQKYRDKMKNEILSRNNLPLLRLNTKNESNEKSRIIQAIKEAKEVENKATISKFNLK